MPNGTTLSARVSATQLTRKIPLGSKEAISAADKRRFKTKTLKLVLSALLCVHRRSAVSLVSSRKELPVAPLSYSGFHLRGVIWPPESY